MTTPTTSRGITDTDVWQAADALLLEGARPTIERVRNKIGRGSPNTVSPHLDTWFRSLGARIVDPKAFSAPPALPDPISQAAGHFWETSLSVARAEAASAQKAAWLDIDQAKQILNAERTNMLHETKKIEAEAHARGEAMLLLKTSLQDANSRVESLSAVRQQQEDEIKAVRARLDSVSTERDVLFREVDRIRIDDLTARSDAAAREQAAGEHWAREVDQARESAKLLRMDIAAKESGFQKVANDFRLALEGAEKDRVTAELVGLELREEITRANAELARTRAALADLQAKLEAREVHYTSLTTRYQDQLSATLSQLATRNNEHGELLRSLVETSKRKLNRRNSSQPKAND